MAWHNSAEIRRYMMLEELASETSWISLDMSPRIGVGWRHSSNPSSFSIEGKPGQT